MKRIINSIIAMFMVFTNSTALASESSDPINGDFIEYIQGGCNAGGFLYRWLMENIFGTGVCTEGGTYTALVSALGYSNVVALGIVSVTLTLTFVIGIFKTAAEGELLGKTWSTFWFPIRVSLGIALILPSQLTGGSFSVSQVLVLEAQHMSAAGAQYIYANTIDDVVSSQSNQPLVSVSGQLLEGVQRLKLLSCVNLLANSGFQRIQNQGFLTIYHGEDKTFELSGKNLSQTDISALKNMHNIEKIEFGSNGRCGTEEFRWNKLDYTKEGIFNKIAFSSADIKRDVGIKMSRAVTNHVIDQYVALLPLSKATSDLQRGMHNLPQGQVKGLGGMGNYAIMSDEYASKESEELLIYAKSILFSLSENGIELGKELGKIYEESDVLKRWAESVKAATWLQFPLYYIDITEVTGIPQKYMSYSINGTSVVKVDKCDDSLSQDIKRLFSSRTDSECAISNQVASNQLALDKVYGFSVSVSDKILRKKSFEVIDGITVPLSEAYKYDLSICTSNACAEKAQGVMYAQPIAEFVKVIKSSTTSPVLEFFGGDADFFHTASALNLPHPILVLKQFGQVLEVVFNALLATAAASLVLEYVSANIPLIGAAASGLFAFIHDVAYDNSIMIGAATVFTKDFVPMMPVLSWIGIIINIVKTLLVALVAAPLSVILLTQPEGQGIAGTRLDRVISLIAAVLFKSFLAVIGCFASIYVGSAIFGIASLLFFNATTLSFDSLTSMYAFVILYPAMVVYVTTETIKFINDIVDGTLAAITGSTQFATANDMPNIATQANADKAAHYMNETTPDSKKYHRGEGKGKGSKEEGSIGSNNED